jgi:arginine decarboxylase
VLTITQSTYDGILYNVEAIKEELDGKIDTLHFDEAWLPHAAFHDFYGDYHAIGADRPRCKESMIFSTQSTHKLLAGLSQASQILVQDAENNNLDRDVFNEAYLMHTSTSPQYSIIASCDVAAAMMEEPGGKALVEESIMPKPWISAAPCARWTRSGAPTGGSRSGARRIFPRKASRSARPGCSSPASAGTASASWPKASICSIRSRPRSSPRAWTWMASSPSNGIPAAIVTKYLAEHGVIVEKCGLYSFFIMFTIGITKGRWNSMVTALQQFKDDYDKNQPLWKVLPEFVAEEPALRAGRPA